MKFNMDMKFNMHMKFNIHVKFNIHMKFNIHKKFKMYLKLSLFNWIGIVAVTCCLSWTKDYSIFCKMLVSNVDI